MSAIKITAPFDCEVRGLEDVPDEVFAERVLGDGVAVIPTDETAVACAPCDGVLTAFFPTGHAFGLTGEDGIEVLVHIGIDTVELNGQGFEPLKQKENRVHICEPVVKVDFKKIAELGKPVITPIIVINPAGREIKFVGKGKIKSGEVLMELV